LVKRPMALVSLSCFFSAFKSSVRDELGGADGFGACAMGAGVFATGGSALIAACGAGVVTLGSGTAARAGRDVGDAGGRDGARDALVAGGGDGDGGMCPRPAQAFSPRIAAATRQICAADIVSPFPTITAACAVNAFVAHAALRQGCFSR
jgi:hypothetical protein